MKGYFLVIIAFLAVCPPLRGVWSVQRRLQTKVQSYAIAEPNFASALAAVASRFKIPIGVELVAAPSVLRPVKRTWQNATGMEILTTIVRGERGYALRVDDGVVHVFRKDLVNQPSNFLNIRVERFQVQDVGAAVAQRRVWEVINPRFQRPRALPPGPHGTISSMLGGGSVRPFSLDLREVTVRYILDKIALSSDCPIWIVAFAPGKALTPTGFHRTASPVSGGVGELAWETLRWGEKPY